MVINLLSSEVWTSGRKIPQKCRDKFMLLLHICIKNRFSQTILNIFRARGLTGAEIPGRVITNMAGNCGFPLVNVVTCLELLSLAWQRYHS